MLVGGSSGMAAYAARQVAQELAGTPGGRRRRDRRPPAGLRARLPDQGLQRRVARAVRLRHRAATPTEQTVGEVLRGKDGRLPDLVHTHPAETIAEAVAILQEYSVSQMPVVRAEPPIVAAEVAGSVSERTLLEALFTGAAHLTDRVEDHMSPPLPTIGSSSPPTRPSRCWRTPTPSWSTRTASPSASSPARTSWPSSPAPDQSIRRTGVVRLRRCSGPRGADNSRAGPVVRLSRCSGAWGGRPEAVGSGSGHEGPGDGEAPPPDLPRRRWGLPCPGRRVPGMGNAPGRGRAPTIGRPTGPRQGRTSPRPEGPRSRRVGPYGRHHRPVTPRGSSRGPT